MLPCLWLSFTSPACAGWVGVLIDLFMARGSGVTGPDPDQDNAPPAKRGPKISG